MPIFSLITIVVSLLGQGLTFSDPHTWSFVGTVIEKRQVLLIGLDTEVLRVQSVDFDTWVIQRMESQSMELGELVLGNASVGDLVRVSISGSHVSQSGVDWDTCQPLYSNYCRQGSLYDTGPLSSDWSLPLSPSNEMIYWGHLNPSVETALFWNIEVLKDALVINRVPYVFGNICLSGGVCSGVGSFTAYRAATGFCCLAGQAFKSGRLEPQ